VREYIVSLSVRGFDIGLVTFDRWESTDLIEQLKKYGLNAEKLSVAKKHYTDLAMVVHESRLFGPDIVLLRNELLRLRIMPNDKIDHPRNGSKDLADATCGAVFNAISHTPLEVDTEIEIKTVYTLRKEMREQNNLVDEAVRKEAERAGSIIRP